MMLKQILAISLLFITLAGKAQIEVSLFRKLPNDQSARAHYPKEDINGQKCAIIKVVTNADGFAWEADALGIVHAERKVGEYWLYIPQGARHISIMHTKFGKLNYAYPEPILEATVYELVLKQVGETTEFRTVSVKLTPTPANAKVKVDGEDLGVGQQELTLPEGAHIINLYGVENYLPTMHRIEVDARGKKDFALKMETEKVWIEIRPKPKNAVIRLNGDSLGIGTQKVELQLGEHSVILDSISKYKKTEHIINVNKSSTEFEVKLARGPWLKRSRIGIKIGSPNFTTINFEYLLFRKKSLSVAANVDWGYFPSSVTNIGETSTILHYGIGANLYLTSRELFYVGVSYGNSRFSWTRPLNNLGAEEEIKTPVSLHYLMPKIGMITGWRALFFRIEAGYAFYKDEITGNAVIDDKSIGFITTPPEAFTHILGNICFGLNF